MGLAPEKGPAVNVLRSNGHSAGSGRPRAGGSAGGRSEGPAEAAEEGSAGSWRPRAGGSAGGRSEGPAVPAQDEGGEARKAEPTAPRPEASSFRRRGAQAP